MIDPMTETVISLTEAAKMLPARRMGKRPHVSCLYRWTQTGCRGVILESIQIGGTRCTSKEKMAIFFQELSGGGKVVASETPAGRQRRRERDVQRANAELDRIGIR